MERNDEIKGIVKSSIDENYGSVLSDLQEKQATLEESNAKLLETNTKMKAQYDALQDKQFAMETKTAGSQLYTFKGYNVSEPTKNFQIACSEDMRKEQTDLMLSAMTEGTTGAALAREYSDALLGLAELQSVSLHEATIEHTTGNYLVLPRIATRATVGHAAYDGTTKTVDAAVAFDSVTFQLDKRLGAHVEILENLLQDMIFDVPSKIEKLIVEEIGQAVDREVFGTELGADEYTTNITDDSGSATVTASGVAGIAAAVTYDNLLAMVYGVELQRGVQPKWYMPMAALRACQNIKDNNGFPIFQTVPITVGVPATLFGYPIVNTPCLDNTPSNGEIRMAFADMNHYTIMLHGGIEFKKAVDGKFLEDTAQYKGSIRSDGNVTIADAFATMKRVDA